MSRLRVGLDAVAARAVVVDEASRIVAFHRGVPGTGSPSRLLDALMAEVGAEAVDRVVAILPEPVPADAGSPVGVLRIGGATALPPLAGWPAETAGALAGPVATVRGGHEYDGTAAEPLDLAAVAEFARRCAGTVRAVAVAGVHGLENPDHEQRAAAVLADVLGPDVPVRKGSETEAIGLLERENTAVLDAALAEFARIRIDALGAAVRKHNPAAELYLVRGDGTVLPEPAAQRHATACLGAARAASLHGAARLAGVPAAVVAEATGRRTVVGTTRGGLLPESGARREFGGVRIGSRLPRLTAVDRSMSLAEAVARARYGYDGLPVVLVGDRSLPDAIRLPDGDLAAAAGAAGAEAAGSVDRIFWQGSGGREDSAVRARQLARDAAIRAGADPRTLRETPVKEALMTYVPVPAARLQATAVGPILEPAPL
ncbi:hydantoinase/oxoprolinase [Amycolatopsis sp. AA4]|uniref:hydantoinase/oxoprolinase N-terminal domain-containing protein n=1 Tax=Actinomycetes TaxID=1760 RepID=UPI0005645836|nr:MULTISPECIES: hydantoinase/oxoprolinase N-terminal domain-containing protein [Actinomycetes]ATY11988.1 hydantoinase/oxoprolinase [Amycolatopsis sp. AA4]